jgi:hypothetical protein
MPELERMLTQLGRELDYPPTPDLAAAVAGRVRAGAAAAPPEGRGSRRRVLPPASFRRALVLALVALLLLAGTLFAAVPSVRDAVLEFFGLQGATVERRAQLPEPPELRPLDLGSRVTLSEAAAALDFIPLVPAALGDPDAVYVRSELPGGELSLAYRPRPGLPAARTTRLALLASEFRGDLHPDLVGKLAGPRTRIESLQMGGRPAIWIEGARHFFFYRDPDGNLIESDLRLAQNVLLIERGRVLVRLEGAFDRGRALEIAHSLTPSTGD